MLTKKLGSLVFLLALVMSTRNIIQVTPGGDNDDLINAFQTYSEEEKKAVYDDYMQKFEKEWDSEDSKACHFETFKKTMKEIHQHNHSNSSYKEGINQFSDLSDEEFKLYHGGLILDKDHKKH